jgi:hypothetical protein
MINMEENKLIGSIVFSSIIIILELVMAIMALFVVFLFLSLGLSNLSFLIVFVPLLFRIIEVPGIIRFVNKRYQLMRGKDLEYYGESEFNHLFLRFNPDKIFKETFITFVFGLILVGLTNAFGAAFMALFIELIIVGFWIVFIKTVAYNYALIRIIYDKRQKSK